MIHIFFIKNIGKTEGKINCIPVNEEKYISFTKTNVVDEFEKEEGQTINITKVSSIVLNSWQAVLMI